MGFLESATWALVLVFAIGVIGSLWQGSTRKQPWLKDGVHGLLWMLVAFPAFLYLSNRLLGWQITAPTLLVTLTIFLIGGFLVSKNLRIK